MRRFVLYFGYCGTRFRGVQKQPDEALTGKPASVQGHLEAGLSILRPANIPLTYVSSRTDKGVHALCNTAHVDLGRKSAELFYDSEFITSKLNTYFNKNEVDIRIQKTLAVPSSFHVRYNAIGRSYLYRLAVLKPGVWESNPAHYISFLPIVELDRVHLVRSPFDIEKFVSGSQLLEGSHNFATFMATQSKTSYPKDPNRTIDYIKVTEGRPFFDPVYEPLYENIHLWDIEISARSFLYKQVRRIVGALVAVAQDRIPIESIQQMLDNPAPQNWNPLALTVPAKGLYLLQVKYPPEAFEESLLPDERSDGEGNNVI